jgi:hypothetical protein
MLNAEVESGETAALSSGKKGRAERESVFFF